MIVIRVELWPHGDESRKRPLGQAVISNDATGTKTRGNYRAAFQGKDGRVLWCANVRNFPRKQRLAWDLIYRALRACVGERNQ